MKVAHLSDLHLGLRAFPRMERGWNLRERDLASAFHAAIQELGRLRPDLVLLSGDLFHQPDPPSTAFLTLTRGIRTLQEALPATPILMIAGERDTPRAPADPGPVAVLDALAGVEAASGAPRAVHLSDLDTHVLMVPYRAVVRPPFPQLRPDPSARWNLLLLRGSPGSRAGALRLDPEGWDYVALGGRHGAQIWDGADGRIRTAGSLERIGPDPFHEARTEKGFWMVDLGTGAGDFHPVPTRPVVDLAPVRVEADSAEEGTRRLRDLLEGLPGGIEGKIVRVRLRGPHGTARAGISPGLLAAIRRRAAHLELQAGPDEDRLPELLAGLQPSGKARLSWSAPAEDADGEGLTLTPGLWLLVADSAEERIRLSEESSRESGTADPRLPSLTLEPADPGSRKTTAIRGWGDPERYLLAEDPGAADATPPKKPIRGVGDRSARELRGDWIEAMGEMEAMSLEWVQERQEADSRLTAYRERARELRERLRTLEKGGADALCPTCHRPLADAHPTMVEELQEEWEDVVQDGRWWKRRREQLDAQPQALRDLDRRVLELQAELQSIAEEVEGDAGGGTDSVPVDRSAPGSSPPTERTIRLLGLAGDLLGRITGGRVQVVQSGDNGLRVRGIEGEERAPSPADLPLISAALQLAVATLDEPPVILLRQFAVGEGPSDVIRLLELVGSSRPSLPVVAILAPEAAERIPELVTGTIELQRSADGRTRIRTRSTGEPLVRVSADR